MTTPLTLVMTVSSGELSVGVADRTTLVLPLQEGNVLADLRARLPRLLGQFKKVVMDGRDPETGVIGWPAVSEGFRQLRLVGLEILARLLRSEDITRLTEHVSNILSSVPLDIDGELAPKCSIRAESARFIPLDLTPIIDPVRSFGQIYDELSLLTAARAYPAFACRVSREPYADTGALDISLAADNGPRAGTAKAKATVAFFMHDALPGAKNELAYLKQLARLDVSGPYPSAGMSRDDAGRIILDEVADILHFSCHADLDTMPPNEICIVVRASGAALTLEHKDFLEWIGQKAVLSQVVRFSPLVVLNACASASGTVLSGSSLPRVLLQSQSTAVVGVETYVPDSVAQFISQHLYDGLTNGLTIDVALHRARMKLLRLRRNPVGALYSVYRSGSEPYRLFEERNSA